MSETREIRYMRPRMDVGGEGSRGGKIIGHTSSGKPIYMNHKHPSHSSFSQQDHMEAATLHGSKVPNEIGSVSKERFPDVSQHMKAETFHISQASPSKGERQGISEFSQKRAEKNLAAVQKGRDQQRASIIEQQQRGGALLPGKR